MGQKNDMLEKLRNDRDQARAAAQALLEAPDYDPNSEALKVAEERAENLDAQIERLVGVLEAQRSADVLDGRISKIEQKAEQKTGSQIEVRESLGAEFTRSEAFDQYRSAPRGRSGMVEVEFEHRALPTGIGSLAGANLNLPKTQIDRTAPPAPTPLLDAITQIQVGTNAVEFVAWSKSAGGAAVVAEGALKPSAEWAPTVVADTLDTIAVYTQLTRQLVEDATAVRSMIDQELVRDVLRAEESEATAALAAAALPTVVGSAGAGDDLLSVIREGIGTVQAAGYQPNAVLLNPADWAALDNVVMSSTLDGPTIRQNFWGLIPIASSSQPAGTATVGDFRAGIHRFYRSQVALYVTDSHADTFLRNVFTLLAERRSLTAVVRPQALVECSVGA